MSKKYPKQKRKDYLAHNKHFDPKLHRAKYFDTFEEAKAWVDEQGGGTIKKRNAEVVHSSGYGLERVDFVPPLRVWGEVYDNDEEVK